MFVLPHFPQSAKPHEISIMLLYSLGYKDAKTIANILGYPTKDTAYKVLRKYRDILPTFRTEAPKTRLMGRGFVSVR